MKELEVIEYYKPEVEDEVWSYKIEGFLFKEVLYVVKETLKDIYGSFDEERIVASTVFYPLSRYTPEEESPKMFQVWSTPRHGNKVIVKVVLRRGIKDEEYFKQAKRAFDKVIMDLKVNLGIDQSSIS